MNSHFANFLLILLILMLIAYVYEFIRDIFKKKTVLDYESMSIEDKIRHGYPVDIFDAGEIIGLNNEEVQEQLEEQGL